MEPDLNETLARVRVKLQGLRICQEWEDLLTETIESGVKLTLGNAVRVWRIGEGKIPGVQRSILWIEDELPFAGYRHMLGSCARV
jgi:hypothetical protein